MSPEVPVFIIVGFQNGRHNNPEISPALFDNVGVTKINVVLVSTKYPRMDYRLSFGKNQFARAYGDVCDFKSKFFLTHDLDLNPNFTPLEYKTLYPLFLFDVRRPGENLKYSITDITINAEFENHDVNVGDNTYAYCVVICDKLVKIQSDGTRMTSVY